MTKLERAEDSIRRCEGCGKEFITHRFSMRRFCDACLVEHLGHHKILRKEG